jgi:hypothetical protein
MYYWACAYLLCVASWLSEDAPPDLADVQIDKRYKEDLVANDLLMHVGGVDALTLDDGSDLLIGVGQVAMDPGATPMDRLKAKRVAEAKATRAVSEFLNTDVSTVSTLIRTSVSAAEDHDGEMRHRSRRVEKFLSSHIQQRSELTARIRRIGYWASADGRFIYVAVAVTPVN